MVRFTCSMKALAVSVQPDARAGALFSFAASAPKVIAALSLGGTAVFAGTILIGMQAGK